MHKKTLVIRCVDISVMEMAPAMEALKNLIIKIRGTPKFKIIGSQ